MWASGAVFQAALPIGGVGQASRGSCRRQACILVNGWQIYGARKGRTPGSMLYSSPNITAHVAALRGPETEPSDLNGLGPFWNIHEWEMG